MQEIKFNILFWMVFLISSILLPQSKINLKLAQDNQYLRIPSFTKNEDRKAKLNFWTHSDLLDSAILIYSDGSRIKHIYTYNANKKLILDLSRTWDGTTWRNFNQKKYTYDSSAKLLTSDILKEWDGAHWVEVSREIFTYDTDGNKANYLYEIWEDSIWVSYSRKNYQHDSNGNMTYYLNEVWDGEKLVNEWRETYAYNSEGNKSSVVTETWTGSNWRNNFQILYKYNVNEYVITNLMKVWKNGIWVNYLRDTQTHNNSGNVISIFSENWDGSNWQNYFRDTNSYDNNENLILNVSETYSEGDWRNYRKKSYHYNSNNNMILELSEIWDGTNWITNNRDSYTYDTNKYLTAIIYEYWDDTRWELYDGSYILNDSFNNNFSFQGAKIELFYKTITDINIKHFIKSDYLLLQNYPNPFNPNTIISYSIPEMSNISLRVFDVLGKEVRTLVNGIKMGGNYKVEFNASNLSSGIYYYRLQSGMISLTRKLMIIK